MNCEDVQAVLLAGDTTPGTEAHLATCAACRAARPGLEALRHRLADPGIWEEPPRALATRVVEDLGESPAVSSRGRGRRWWAVAAAVLVVVVGAGYLTLRPGHPDWTVRLAPTALAPRASATVEGWNTATGTRMRLAVSGLPATGNDAYYEVWLTAPDGRKVTAGTFRDSGTVTVWAAVSRADFPRLWITREPADGDPAPSWETVLDTPR